MLTRRRFLAAGAGAGAACWLGRALQAEEGKEEKSAPGGRRNNVLFIAVDDLRPELGCFGHPLVKSPHIDRLAASGTIFTRAYCQQAVCAPSRASLLTGCRPDTTKIYDLNHPLRSVMPNAVTLPQLFRRNGYYTAGIGKIYHHAKDDAESWDLEERYPGAEYLLEANRALVAERLKQAQEEKAAGKSAGKSARGPAFECADVKDNEYADGKIADKAIEILNAVKDKPFFLALGFQRPHLPFNAPKKYWDLYDPEKIRLPVGGRPNNAPALAFSDWGELRAYSGIPGKGPLDDAQARRLIHGYYASVSYMDAQLGRVLGELDRLGLRENTVVVLWGDHGWKLGDFGDWCKHTNFELDTNAPLILSAPGQPKGQKCAALVEFVDVFPTLAELCALEAPKECEGRSVVPLLREPGRKWKKAAFSQYPRGKTMGYSLRTERWRYTEWIDGNTKEVTARELYDHADSARATENLAAAPEHAERVKQLAEAMKAGWRGALPE